MDRQEIDVYGKIHNGSTLLEAFTRKRWVKELASDLQDQQRAEELADLCWDELQRGYSPENPKQSVQAVYGLLRVMVERKPVGSGEHFVYKLFDERGRLLYVGMTSRGPSRLVEHHRKKPWFGDVAEVTFERFETRSLAAKHERDTILRSAPLYNVQHNGRTARRAANQSEHSDRPVSRTEV